MSMWDFLPSPFPLPPIPMGVLPKPRWDGEEEEEEMENEEVVGEEFKNRMRSKGFDPELIEMGLKVAKNHMRPSEEAFKIGENYIKEMAK